MCMVKLFLAFGVLSSVGRCVYGATSEQVRAVHAKMDSDKDGKLTVIELVMFDQRMKAIVATHATKTWFEEFDEDKDGKLSSSEFHKHMGETDFEKTRFKTADTDGDGSLSPLELAHVFHPHTHDDMLAAVLSHKLGGKDTDGNGHLTPGEFGDQDHEKAEFGKLDVDGSKTLSGNELKNWISRNHEKEGALVELFHTADVDKDDFVSADELVKSLGAIAGTEGSRFMENWAATHHEL